MISAQICTFNVHNCQIILSNLWFQFQIFLNLEDLILIRFILFFRFLKKTIEFGLVYQEKPKSWAQEKHNSAQSPSAHQKPRAKPTSRKPSQEAANRAKLTRVNHCASQAWGPPVPSQTRAWRAPQLPRASSPHARVTRPSSLFCVGPAFQLPPVRWRHVFACSPGYARLARTLLPPRESPPRARHPDFPSSPRGSRVQKPANQTSPRVPLRQPSIARRPMHWIRSIRGRHVSHFVSPLQHFFPAHESACDTCPTHQNVMNFLHD